MRHRNAEREMSKYVPFPLPSTYHTVSVQAQQSPHHLPLAGKEKPQTAAAAPPEPQISHWRDTALHPRARRARPFRFLGQATRYPPRSPAQSGARRAEQARRSHSWLAPISTRFQAAMLTRLTPTRPGHSDPRDAGAELQTACLAWSEAHP